MGYISSRTLQQRLADARDALKKNAFWVFRALADAYTRCPGLENDMLLHEAMVVVVQIAPKEFLVNFRASYLTHVTISVEQGRLFVLNGVITEGILLDQITHAVTEIEARWVGRDALTAESACVARQSRWFLLAMCGCLYEFHVLSRAANEAPALPTYRPKRVSGEMPKLRLISGGRKT